MKEYNYEQCRDALLRLTDYMEILNEQMEYTKEEIRRYSRNYRKAAKKLRAAGQKTDNDTLIRAKQSIKYFTKEEFEQ